MIAITGATGQLGRLVIEELLKTVSAAQIVAVARDPDKAEDLAVRGVHVRQADYDAPTALEAAFQDVDRLLLISSSEVGQRVAQHRNVIEAARRTDVGLVAYTSILHADVSPLGLAAEHKETEALLKDSGLPYVLLRNGWYTENYLASVASAVQHGELQGSAGTGRIASAARADYAAAVVLTGTGQAGKIHELAGDEAYTLGELAAEIARLSGRPVAYRDLPQAEFQTALEGAGLPVPVAAMLADSDAGAARDGLFDDGHHLSALVGRPTTSWKAMLADTLRA